MFEKFISAFFLFCVAISLQAQSVASKPSWFVQTAGVVTRYHSTLDYQIGFGASASIGHFIYRRWLAAAISFEYNRAPQTLQLVTGRYETRTDVYRSLFSLCGTRALGKSAILCFVGVLGGLSFFQPQPLTINAGAAGEISFHPPGEKKITGGWEGGLALPLLKNMPAFLAVRQNFTSFSRRQSGTDNGGSQWLHEWNYLAGLFYNF